MDDALGVGKLQTTANLRGKVDGLLKGHPMVLSGRYEGLDVSAA